MTTFCTLFVVLTILPAAFAQCSADGGREFTGCGISDTNAAVDFAVQFELLTSTHSNVDLFEEFEGILGTARSGNPILTTDDVLSNPKDSDEFSPFQYQVTYNRAVIYQGDVGTALAVAAGPALNNIPGTVAHYPDIMKQLQNYPNINIDPKHLAGLLIVDKDEEPMIDKKRGLLRLSMSSLVLDPAGFLDRLFSFSEDPLQNLLAWNGY